MSTRQSTERVPAATAGAFAQTGKAPKGIVEAQGDCAFLGFQRVARRQ
jgi:hypothetical protein